MDAKSSKNNELVKDKNEVEGYLYHFHKGKDINDNLNIEKQKQNIYSFFNQQLFANNLAIFIGSGCSTPAVPLMNIIMRDILGKNEELLKTVKAYLSIQKPYIFISYLENIKEKNNQNNQNLESLINYINNIQNDEKFNTIGKIYKNIKDNKQFNSDLFDQFYKSFSDIESLLNWIQNGIKFNPLNNNLTNNLNELKDEFIKYIPKFDAKVYSDDVFKIYQEFYRYVFNKRSEQNSKVSIFTTNYDLFNEYGLEANNILYSTGFEPNLQKKFNINQFKYRTVDDTNRYKDKWQAVSKEANLYKIHGSINWVFDKKYFLKQDDNSLESSKVVIYPTVMKHKETAQSPYSELFRAFVNCLQKKDTTLIVIGYGFPDEHINKIISQNLSNKDFNLIIFGNMKEKNIENFYNDFKEYDGLHIIGGEEGKYKAHYFNYILDNFMSPDFSITEKGEAEKHNA